MKHLKGRIYNLTPHDIRLLDKATDNTIHVILKSGHVARVMNKDTVIGTLNGIELVSKEIVEIEGLPEYNDDKYYIVSLQTAYAIKESGRRCDDILIVNETKRETNDDGSVTIKGCYSFSTI